MTAAGSRPGGPIGVFLALPNTRSRFSRRAIFRRIRDVCAREDRRRSCRYISDACAGREWSGRRRAERHSSDNVCPTDGKIEVTLSYGIESRGNGREPKIDVFDMTDIVVYKGGSIVVVENTEQVTFSIYTILRRFNSIVYARSAVWKRNARPTRRFSSIRTRKCTNTYIIRKNKHVFRHRFCFVFLNSSNRTTVNNRKRNAIINILYVFGT